MDSTLERVKEFADKAHGDQLRKYSSDRYIVHLIRVMEICRQYTSSLPILAAALLHDVLEDTKVTKHELNEHLSSLMDQEDVKRTMQLVIELTDVYTKAKYPYWNRRKRRHKEAVRIEKTSAESQTIKYADIIDNCSGIAKDDPKFAFLFLRECRMLLKKIPKGNQDLYVKAKEAVWVSLDEIPQEYCRVRRRKKKRNLRN
jgi:(p)ppGpp synthase/HD superfamily hydrolase